MTLEVDSASEDLFEEQEFSSESEQEQESASESVEAPSQEPDYRAELDALTQRLKAAEADLSGTKSAKDREVQALRDRNAALANAVLAERAKEGQQMEQAERRRLLQLSIDDPEAFAAEVTGSWKSQEAAQKAAERTAKEVRQAEYDAIMHDDTYTVEEREKAQALAMKDPKGLSVATLTRHLKAVVKEASEARIAEIQAEMKAKDEELAAFKGSATGQNMRGAGGPETPVNGAGGRSVQDRIMDPNAHFTLAELEAMAAQIG